MLTIILLSLKIILTFKIGHDTFLLNLNDVGTAMKVTKIFILKNVYFYFNFITF
jgi:hypothetical protein